MPGVLPALRRSPEQSGDPLSPALQRGRGQHHLRRRPHSATLRGQVQDSGEVRRGGGRGGGGGPGHRHVGGPRRRDQQEGQVRPDRPALRQHERQHHGY